MALMCPYIRNPHNSQTLMPFGGPRPSLLFSTQQYPYSSCTLNAPLHLLPDNHRKVHLFLFHNSYSQEISRNHLKLAEVITVCHFTDKFVINITVT